MNIQILDSWLREHLKTKATPQKIGEIMSLKSASFERIQKIGTDYLYDIEITTNRVDMMSVEGIAREAAVALSSEGIAAEFIPVKTPLLQPKNDGFDVKIINDPKLCKRICAAILTVTIKDSPQLIKQRLEASNIRAINNAIDVTNYVMRELGHPMHAFDADKISSEFKIREATTGEKITTLDKKEYTLKGGEIVAEDTHGTIIDLLGIMGLSNSSVSDSTKRIMLFIDNNDSKKIRDASMNLNIRTDAAVLNEKDVDPELGIRALERGVQLLTEIADGKLQGSIFDLYPKPIKSKPITITRQKIISVMGVDTSKSQIEQILKGLGFDLTTQGDTFTVTAPTYRAHDIEIPEDIIEEVARMYGYYKIPSILPTSEYIQTTHLETDPFYWEKRVKDALKYWGFTEVYTYSLVSEDMLEVSTSHAVELLNPLSLDMTHLRTALIPSLIQTVKENKSFEYVKIFEMANVYIKNENDLPTEKLILAGIIKKTNINFLEVKGIIEALSTDVGITNVDFSKNEEGDGADIKIDTEIVGKIEVLSRNSIDFEIDFGNFIKHATLKKTYTPIAKFPPAVEDIRLLVPQNAEYSQIVSVIKKTNALVVSVELLDVYNDKKTFRITYQSPERNLSNADITQARESVLSALKKELNAITA